METKSVKHEKSGFCSFLKLVPFTTDISCSENYLLVNLSQKLFSNGVSLYAPEMPLTIMIYIEHKTSIVCTEIFFTRG